MGWYENIFIPWKKRNTKQTTRELNEKRWNNAIAANTRKDKPDTGGRCEVSANTTHEVDKSTETGQTFYSILFNAAFNIKVDGVSN